MIEELKPCPFCGSESHTIETSGIIGQPGVPTYTIYCDGCHASSATELSEADAIAAWNTRTDPDKRLREALERAAIDVDALVLVHTNDPALAMEAARRVRAALSHNGG